MSDINRGRMTAEIDGEFVVFLLGMRINKWWKLQSWLPVFFAMPKMLRELHQDKNLGFLGSSGTFGVIIQYWRSYEHLECYARNRDKAHVPAWVAFNKSVANANGDVGIWHETYVIKPGQWEAIYGNMPVFGLGKASRTVAIGKSNDTARKRLRTEKL